MTKRKKREEPDRNRIHVAEERRPEAGQKRTQSRTRSGHPKLAIILLLVWIGLFFGSVLFPITYYGMGTGGLHVKYWNPAYVMESFTRNWQQSYELFVHGEVSPVLTTYCKFLAIALAGAALASCGTAFQGTFKNVLAGPSTMGTMSGGSLGLIIYLMFFYTDRAYAQQAFTIAGCFGGMLFVLLVSFIAGRGKVSPSAMVVAGTVFSGVTSNIFMVIQYTIIGRDPEDIRLETLRELMLGSFNRIQTLRDVGMMGIPIGVCLFILFCLRGRLNLLSFGTDEAAAAGVNVQFYMGLMILIGTVLTAMVLAFCGRIGFIGFMVPLVLRKLTGPDLRRLVPAAMAGGAILLTVVYDVARLAGMTDPINMFTSLVGCTVLVVTLLRKGGRRDDAGKSTAAPGMVMH